MEEVKINRNVQIRDKIVMDNQKLSAELIKEAKRHPNGYVYVLDKEFEGKEEVSPEFMKGAWKVDKNGIIEGDFLPNPKYHGNK